MWRLLSGLHALARRVMFVLCVTACLSGCAGVASSQPPQSTATPSASATPNGERLADPNTIPLHTGASVSAYSPEELGAVWDSNGRGLDTTHKALYDELAQSLAHSSAEFLDPTTLHPRPLGSVLSTNAYPFKPQGGVGNYLVMPPGQLPDLRPVLAGYLGADKVRASGKETGAIFFAISQRGKNYTMMMSLPFDQVKSGDGSPYGQVVSWISDVGGGNLGFLALPTLVQFIADHVGEAMVILFATPSLKPPQDPASAYAQTYTEWETNIAKVDGLLTFLKTGANRPDSIYPQMPDMTTDITLAPWAPNLAEKK
jgi:hypothetical protein